MREHLRDELGRTLSKSIVKSGMEIQATCTEDGGSVVAA